AQQRTHNSAEQITGEVEKPSRKKIRILVADDSVSTRDIEQSILESYGYVVKTAGDGKEALELAADEQFDLVITDIEMPRLDGITLAHTLRGKREYRHTPIILVTSRDSPEDRTRGIQAGADAYIVKSAFDQGVLIETINTLVG
nr:response regulator [Spirochaetales bacterium]